MIYKLINLLSILMNQVRKFNFNTIKILNVAKTERFRKENNVWKVKIVEKIDVFPCLIVILCVHFCMN